MDRVQYELTLAQQPKRGRVCAYKGGKGGILDPLPIVKLRVHDGDRSNKFIFSPHMFMIARLSRVDREDPTDLTDDSRLLHGNLSATNTKLRQDDNVVENASYFIYPELAVSEEGTYRLTFNLWENQVENSQRCVAVLLASITTDKFQGAVIYLGIFDDEPNDTPPQTVHFRKALRQLFLIIITIIIGLTPKRTTTIRPPHTPILKTMVGRTKSVRLRDIPDMGMPPTLYRLPTIEPPSLSQLTVPWMLSHR
ncbi:putative developmental regulator [Phaeomoniella chlamydospora]|uniref:Putative developmental regulator n=1 Tax=Phaeomoniella chlamydospora TaxID=158046 RepID=A0A0G2F3R8_PHACM|nr:putative developmental regulator [Phaeomoniella chlamydospora]